MRLSFTAITSVLFSAVSILAASGESQEQEAAAVAASKQEPTSINFYVDYTIKEYPEVANTDVAQFTNGEQIQLEFNVVNNENDNIVVVGCGGTFRDPITNKVKANLTAATIGPITLEPGQNEQFIQKISIDLLSNNYLLTPQIFIAYQEDLKLIQARGQLAVVEEVPISFFDPQLIFLEIILTLSFGVLAYFAYSIWGQAYFQGTAPVNSKKSTSVKSSSGVATGGNSYDSSWIPEGHLQKQQPKKRSRKAY